MATVLTTSVRNKVACLQSGGGFADLRSLIMFSMNALPTMPTFIMSRHFVVYNTAAKLSKVLQLADISAGCFSK